MPRLLRFLTTMLCLVIAAGCAQSPATAPSEVLQSRVLPPLSAFAVVQHPNFSRGHDDDDDDDDDNDGDDNDGNDDDENGNACTQLRRDEEDKEIGSKGGILEIGPHALVVPAGALSQKTRITARIATGTVNSIRFTPEGLQFLRPVYLFMSYANCGKTVADQVEILYTSHDSKSILEHLPSFDDMPAKSVVALLNHFSRYAVAY